jgi:uncharacterized protein YjiS (DUF1127 family)
MAITFDTVAAPAIARPALATPAVLHGLVRRAARALRYRAHYRGIMRELGRFDAHMLKDIGIPHGELEAFAHAAASEKAAAGGSMLGWLATLAEPTWRFLGPRTGAAPGLWR